ncbi:uncharacterized protein FOMMEDRAFT_148756 [Fomitiporia mediterranea MF3/22]|uniref:uncharacterized protein n=1 Tax=Fomitiporia mediterranea (strain MF3/22) TaxID=694068 RepID=UPI0004409462|nr:uncharacterized protein FOMMEDRAFT_148756 [Fomitiporia mediterranea MF3/22]EJC99199.1 hypothetical protein FOMMEDRAFT_148756 [Fomitiporia mediterranea MF3/22]
MLLTLLSLVAAGAASVVLRAPDPCAAIGGQKWVAPSAVRACFESFPINETIKENILEVVTKSLAFHTSVNYQLRAPEPFTADVHEDILGDLARIGRTSYPSEFEMHIDLSRSVKRLMDGHCVYINMCYDSLFLTFVPTPLVLLTDAQGNQAVHIAPEAFEVASAEFADEIPVWQNALPGNLKGNLASLSGAKVLAINGKDPFVAVDANAAITGSFQGFGTRQNSFFSSYQRVDSGWNYVMGNFAQMSLPLADSVTLTVQRVNSSKTETFTLPYRSRFGSTSVNFTDSATFRENNCVAVDGTNGMAISENSFTNSPPAVRRLPGGRFAPKPTISPEVVSKHLISLMLDDKPQTDVVLPSPLQPASPVAGTGVSQFFLLDDGKTGVLALGSFEEPDFDTFETTLLSGLQTLVGKGATQLIVDVTNNGGGFICIAHWLHRIIAGPKNTTVPQAGLDTKARAGPLAQLIVDQIVTGADPNNFLLYNPLNWAFANNTPFPANFNWLQDPVKTVINGRQDAFSQRLGQECQPFDMTTPDAPLFDTSKVAIVSNGRCASSCSLFSVTMNKEEGAKMVVVGGKKDVTQQYCGTVGGQSSDFSTMDTEVKTTHLKNNSLAPPDFLTNSVQGITWRLGFGIVDPTQPEEWQDRTANVNFPLTAETVNNPMALWKAIAASVL